MMTELARLGWNTFFEEQFKPFGEQGLAPARVTQQHRGTYMVWGERGEMVAVVTGKFRHEALSRGAFPAVGDWVVVPPETTAKRTRICAVLPRQSFFARKLSGMETDEQVAASNIDTVFIVCGLDGDFNPRRIQRYLVVARDGGVKPVILLNKADLCADVAGRVAEAEAISAGVPVCSASVVEKRGLEAIERYVGLSQTVAMLGSSGVGKSSLINWLLGEGRQDVQPVRQSDGRGRHTTTRRELIFLPQGGMAIDTPGMRQMPLWIGDEGPHESFDDIGELSLRCRFHNCGHKSEPGCAVKAAVQEGHLDQQRLNNYWSTQEELGQLEKKQAAKAQIAVKAAKKKKQIRGRMERDARDNADQR
jgi:ribosome biogenesis GTPase / thiamine phosphate phosphatase